jgi:hypothetical protein
MIPGANNTQNQYMPPGWFFHSATAHAISPPPPCATRIVSAQYDVLEKRTAHIWQAQDGCLYASSTIKMSPQPDGYGLPPDAFNLNAPLATVDPADTVQVAMPAPVYTRPQSANMDACKPTFSRPPPDYADNKKASAADESEDSELSDQLNERVRWQSDPKVA